jgi:membrane protein YqaA with SNARE-associated domain
MALYFFELVLTWMTPGMTEEFHQLSAANGGSAFVLTLLGAVTPVPYTIVAWAVAALKESLWLFVIGSVIGRSFRYIVVGYSTYRFGDLAISYAKRYIGLTSVVLFILAGLFLWLKM